MHGDIIARLKQNATWIGHYHTAGVPGQNEIDDTQEIQYAPIMKAILAPGCKGFVGQEFIPLRIKPRRWPRPFAFATCEHGVVVLTVGS